MGGCDLVRCWGKWRRGEGSVEVHAQCERVEGELSGEEGKKEHNCNGKIEGSGLVLPKGFGVVEPPRAPS